MNFLSDYYINDAQQLDIIYDNDSSDARFVPEMLTEGTPFEHVISKSINSGRKKIIVINDWLDSHLDQAGFLSNVDMLLNNGFVVLQADGDIVRQIYTLSQVDKTARAILDENKLRKTLLEHDLKISADHVLILDYYRIQLINNPSLDENTLNYHDVANSRLKPDEYNLIVNNKSLYLSLKDFTQESDAQILTCLLSVVENVIVEDYLINDPTNFFQLIKVLPNILEKTTKLILNNTYLISHLHYFKKLSSVSIKTNLQSAQFKQITNIHKLSLSSLNSAQICSNFPSELPVSDLYLKDCNESEEFNSNLLKWPTLENIHTVGSDNLNLSLLNNHPYLKTIHIVFNTLNITQPLPFLMLKTLIIEHINYTQMSIVDSSLDNILINTPQLENLLLENLDLSNTPLLILPNKLHNLLILRLNNTIITNSQLSTILLAAPNLEGISLINSYVIGDIDEKASLYNLKALEIKKSNITSKSIRFLLSHSKVMEYLDIPFFDDNHIPNISKTLKFITFNDKSETEAGAETSLWLHNKALALVNLPLNTSAVLDISGFSFIPAEHEDNDLPIHAIKSVIFPKRMDEISYLRLLKQTPNINMSSNLLVPVAHRSEVNEELCVVTPLNLVNITTLNFNASFSQSIIYSLIAGCPYLKKLSLDKIKLVRPLPDNLCLNYLEEIEIHKYLEISEENIKRLIIAAPNLKILKVYKRTVFKVYSILCDMPYNRSIDIISEDYPILFSFQSDIVINPLVTDFAPKIHHPSFLSITINDTLVSIKSNISGYNEYIKYNKKNDSYFENNRITKEERAKISSFLFNKQMSINASSINQYICSSNSSLSFNHCIIHASFNVNVAQVHIIKAIIYFDTLKTLLENNLNQNCVIILDQAIIISPNKTLTHQFITQFIKNFPNPQFFVTNSHDMTADLFNWASAQGLNPEIRYKFLLNECPILNISHTINKTSNTSTSPDFQTYAIESYRESSSHNNNWSQRFLIECLNLYLSILYPSPKERLNTLIAKNNRGICQAVVVWYIETITQQDNTLTITQGVELWRSKLRAVKAFKSTYTPTNNSLTYLVLKQLWEHAHNIYIQYIPTANYILIPIDLDMLFQNIPTEVLYIRNSRHGTCVIYKEDTWVFFDPNASSGEAVYFNRGDEEQLKNEIYRVLGHGLAIETKTPLVISSNYDQLSEAQITAFFNDGGFDLLLHVPDFQEVFNLFKISEREITDLQSIFNLSIKNKPFWYAGLCDLNGASATVAWLSRYKSLSPTQFQEKMNQGLKLLTYNEHIEINGILTNFAQTELLENTNYLRITATIEEPLESILDYQTPADDSLQLQSMSCQTMVNSSYTLEYVDINDADVTQEMLDFHIELYKKDSHIPLPKPTNTFLKKTASALIPSTTICDFDAFLLSNTSQNILLEFTNQITLMSYLHHIQQTQKATSRGVFVISSMRDLQCLTGNTYIDKDNHCTTLPPPSGPFNDFLKVFPGHDPIIIFRGPNFKIKEIIDAQAVFTSRRIGGNFIPHRALILWLQNSDAKNAYRGADFIAHQDQVIQFPTNIYIPPVIWEHNLVTIADENPIIIEFYDDPNWQQYFYGHYIMDNNVMTFFPSQFLETIKHSSSSTCLNFIFKNAPMHIEEFRYAINSLLCNGYITYKGLTFHLFSDINIKTQTGYNFIQQEPAPVFSEGFMTNYDVVLNPKTLSLFFVQYKYMKNELGLGTLSTSPGFIELYRENDLHVYLTRSIGLSSFAKLLERAYLYNCRLKISLAPNTTLPHQLQQFMQPNAHLMPNRSVTISSNKAYLIVSNDLRIAEQTLIEEMGPITVIDISELKGGDIFYQLTTKVEQENLIIDEQIKYIWSAVLKGATFVLKGNFSSALADTLAPLFNLNGGIYYNDTLQMPRGQLIILTEDDSEFNYVTNKEIRHYTFADRIAPLPLEFQNYAILHQAELSNYSFDKLYSLSKQAAWPSSPKQFFNNILSLPHDSNIFDEDLSVDEESARDFLNNRFTQIKAGVKRMPILFLLGETGTAKSTTMHELHEDRTQKTDVFFGDILSWVQSSTENQSILFIDEANLINTDFSIFESLFSTPRTIFYENKLYQLTEKHTVVFAGNPDNYGGGRKTPALFNNHPNIEFFGEMSNAYIFHKILKPFVDNNKYIGTLFLQVFQKIKSIDKKSISARELQMMGFLYKVRVDQGNAIMCAKQCAMDIALPLLTLSARINFQSWFNTMFGELEETIKSYPESLGSVDNSSSEARRPAACPRDPAIVLNVQHDCTEKDRTGSRGQAAGRRNLNCQHAINSPRKSAEKPFYLMPSHYEIYDKLYDLIKIRALKQSTFDSQMKFGGLAGLFVKGNPGSGKSHFLKQFLLSRGFIKRKIEKETLDNYTISDFLQTPTNYFYYIPSNMNLELKIKILQWAFHEGSVVIIHKINASGTMIQLERVINALSMGEDLYGNRARNSGFTLLATGEPTSMLCRDGSSLAIERRFMHCYYKDYAIVEMKRLLTNHGVNEKTASILLSEFIEVNKNSLSCVTPSYRALINQSTTNNQLRLPAICYDLLKTMGTINTPNNIWMQSIFEIISMLKSNIFTSFNALENLEYTEEIQTFVKAIVKLLAITNYKAELKHIFIRELQKSPHYIAFTDHIQNEIQRSQYAAKPALTYGKYPHNFFQTIQQSSEPDDFPPKVRPRSLTI